MWYRDPLGNPPANDPPRSLSVSARALRWLIVAAWIAAIGVSAVGWIVLIWFASWLWF